MTKASAESNNIVSDWRFNDWFAGANPILKWPEKFAQDSVCKQISENPIPPSAGLLAERLATEY